MKQKKYLGKIIMPTLPPQIEFISLEQFEALPEDKRAEVFDGIIYDMPSPSQIHQALSMELSNIIYNYIKIKREPVKFSVLHSM